MKPTRTERVMLVQFAAMSPGVMNSFFAEQDVLDLDTDLDVCEDAWAAGFIDTTVLTKDENMTYYSGDWSFE